MKKRFFFAIRAGVIFVILLLVFTGCSTGKAYNYDLSKYVKVGEYKGLEYTDEEITVTNEEVREEIDRIRRRNASVEEVKEGIVCDGDTINVAYKGRIDGKEFESGSTDSSDLIIGKSQMIDGFIEGLTGREIGSKVTLDLTFPDDYHAKDLAGKDVVFEVDIKCKKVEKIPEYDLDFVKANSKFDSIEEYEKSIKDSLLTSRQDQADEMLKQGLWSQIVQASEIIKYPEKELKKLIRDTRESIKNSVLQQGLEWEDYLKQSGTTEEDFNKTLEDFAKERIGQDLIVYAIARKEKLEVSRKEYKGFMEDLLKSAGFTEETFKDNFGMSIEKYCEGKGLRTSMLHRKVMDKVIEYGKAV